MSVRVGEEWTHFAQAFAAVDDMDVGTAQLTFRLGFPNQVLELGAPGLENYGQALGLQRLSAFDAAEYVEVASTPGFTAYGDVDLQTTGGLEYPFGFALRLSTRGRSFVLPQDAGLQGRNSLPIQQQDLLLAMFWARCVESQAADGSCRTAAVFEETNSPYKNLGLESGVVTVRTAWQRFFFPFRAVRDSAVDSAKFGLRLGYADQTIEVGPIVLQRFASDFAQANLPQTSSK
jgi:hypothetical protein